MTLPTITGTISQAFPGVSVVQLNPDSKLKDIVGWDSMNAVNLLAELEKTFGVNLENETLRESMTLADVARLVEAHGGKCGDM